MVEHTEECLREQEEMARMRRIARVERFVWLLAWPDHCRTCEGFGGSHYHYDPSPAGLALGSGTMTDYDPCPDCTERGLCARCGKPALGEEAEGPCGECGWDYDQGLPEYPYAGGPCQCEIDEWAAEAAEAGAW